MPAVEVKGRILSVLPVEYIKNIEKQSIVLDTTTNPEYPEVLCVDFINKAIQKIDADVIPGAFVTIKGSLNSKEWTGADGKVSYFTGLKAISIKIDQSVAPLPVSNVAAPPPPSSSKIIMEPGCPYTEQALKQSAWTDEAIVAEGWAKWR